jgi:hypothetical protein
MCTRLSLITINVEGSETPKHMPILTLCRHFSLGTEFYMFTLLILPSRVWVLQEAALAKSNTCYCGKQEFDLLDITRAARWLCYNAFFVDLELSEHSGCAADMNDLIDRTHGFYASKNWTPHATFLLNLSRSRLATDPIDKLYGILALTTKIDGSKELDVFPDYKKTIADAFREAAWCVIKKHGSLHILQDVRHRNDGPTVADAAGDGFSSWVPDWHEGEDPDYLSDFNACLGRKSLASSLNADQVASFVALDGIQIAKVRETSGRITKDTLKSAATYREVILLVKAIISTVEDVAANYQGDSSHWKCPESATLALASTLVAGVDSNEQPVTPDLHKQYSALCDLLKVTQPTTVQEPPQLPPTIIELSGDENSEIVLASQYRQAMWVACKGRAFFTTDIDVNGKWYMGLGPQFMQEGDVVVILYGLKVPAVLRPTEDGKWLFLGVCYVHGIMFGEAVQMNDLRKERGEGGDCIFKIC